MHPKTKILVGQMIDLKNTGASDEEIAKRFAMPADRIKSIFRCATPDRIAKEKIPVKEIPNGQ